jgi:hypothetical protein
MRVEVAIVGCDDETQFEMTVDVDELYLLETVAEKSAEASEFGCQPVMSVRRLDG